MGSFTNPEDCLRAAKQFAVIALAIDESAAAGIKLLEEGARARALDKAGLDELFTPPLPIRL